MSETFEYKPGAAEQIPLLSGSLIEFAFNQAQEFVDLGHSVHQTTSTVANLLLDTAWKVAANGAIADGATPNPDRFRARVEEVIDRTKWRETEAEAEPETDAAAPAPQADVALSDDLVKAVMLAIVSCGHEIDQESVALRYSHKQSGFNAYGQLSDRVRKAILAITEGKDNG